MADNVKLKVKVGKDSEIEYEGDGKLLVEKIIPAYLNAIPSMINGVSDGMTKILRQIQEIEKNC